MKVIITGATGMVGEGVLLECLENKNVSQVLVVGRKSCGRSHPKLKELLVPDFMKLENYGAELKGYDACFFCAGISSVGMNEKEFTHVAYDITLHFAKTLAQINPNMIFDYVSGGGTDSSEKGKMMWARVKGKTENDLMRLPFKGQYNFRPGFMKPYKGQKNVRWFFRPIIWIFPYLLPSISLTMSQVGKAMINTVLKGYPKQILEVKDIRELAGKE